MKLRFRYIIIFLLIPIIGFGAPKIRITTDAPGNKIEVGETFHITIEAIDCKGSISNPELPPGVKKVYHTTSQMETTSVVNGITEHSVTTSLILTCKGMTPGTYKYGPVIINGIKSNVISYQVVNARTGSNNNQNGASSSTANSSTSQFDPNSGPLFVGKGNEEMFLRANVNKTSAYEQEAIEYTVKLYTSYDNIKFLGAAAAPKFDGFVIEESKDISNSLSLETMNGKNYKTAIIARYIIFPQKSGKLKVQGNTYTVSTDAKQYYDDPYFQTMTVRYPIQLNVTPNDIVIDVKALPQPIPDNFIGGVGNFSITSSLASSQLTTNAASTITYKIEGTGNVKYLKMPDLGKFFPKSIEVYTPDVSVDVKVGSSNVSGYSKFDFSIVPQEAGDFVIPALELTYFDPSEGQYKKLITQSYDINVTKGTTSAKSQQALTFNNNLLPDGKPKQDLGRPYVNSWLYWLWFIIPSLIFTISLIFYRKYLKDHEDLTLLRSKKANKMALKRLSKAYQCIKNHQEEQFYDEMLSALWGYIGDKLKMPTSELNRSNVGEEFEAHGVKESTFKPILNLIDECEYAKYTPVSRNSNMHQIYEGALNSLSKVEKEYMEETRGKEEEGEDSDPQSQSAKYVNSMTSVTQPSQESGSEDKENEN